MDEPSPTLGGNGVARRRADLRDRDVEQGQKRVEWATRVGDRLGRIVDARVLADASLGPLLGEATQRQIERAADGPQALALLLMAPEFQRR